MYIPFLKTTVESGETIFYWDEDEESYTFETPYISKGEILRDQLAEIIEVSETNVEVCQCEEMNYIKRFDIPESCFKQYWRGFYEFEISEKKIFIFENHASAILAWFKLQQNPRPSLVTFDHHTDTMAPLLRYKNSSLDRDEKIFLSELDFMKEHLSENLLKELLVPGSYLKKRKSGYANEALVLWHDEQISTSIYFELINKAYIVAPRKGDDFRNSKENYLSKIYHNIFYLHDFLLNENIYEIEDNHEREMLNYQCSNIGNDLIKKIIDKIPEDEAIILDIDLDYFKDISVLENDLSDYSEFAKLVRKSKGITIATEPGCVDENVEWYNLNVIHKNLEVDETNRLWGRNWNAQDCFEKLMKIIQASLENRI